MLLRMIFWWMESGVVCGSESRVFRCRCGNDLFLGCFFVIGRREGVTEVLGGPVPLFCAQHEGSPRAGLKASVANEN